MKKITLLIAFFVFAIGFSQKIIRADAPTERVKNQEVVTTRPVTSNNLDRSQEGNSSIEGYSLLNRSVAAAAFCSEQNPSNGFEDGIFSSTKLPDQVVATDMTIPADTDFSLTSVNANLGIRGFGETITSADIVIYGDMGAFPDSANIIASFPALVPTSQIILGTAFTFFEVLDVTFDIPATMLAGQAGATTTYWISIFSTSSNADDVFWEATTASVIGNQGAFNFFNAATWESVGSGRDLVYDFSGDCTPITLGTEDNTLEGFVYYPNPAESTLILSAQDAIERVVIYNMLGQKVFDRNISATTYELNVSDLATGAYFMKVSVNGQIGTYKILKK